MTMDDLEDRNEIDVEAARLLTELCIYSDDRVVQQLLDKAKELGISLKPNPTSQIRGGGPFY
jgi:hypothetical protein